MTMTFRLLTVDEAREGGVFRGSSLAGDRGPHACNLSIDVDGTPFAPCQFKAGARFVGVRHAPDEGLRWSRPTFVCEKHVDRMRWWYGVLPWWLCDAFARHGVAYRDRAEMPNNARGLAPRAAVGQVWAWPVNPQASRTHVTLRSIVGLEVGEYEETVLLSGDATYTHTIKPRAPSPDGGPPPAWPPQRAALVHGVGAPWIPDDLQTEMVVGLPTP